MRSCLLILFFSNVLVSAFAQSKLDGIVTDTKGEALIGANVYVVGSYDGSITDENGHFSFITDQVGQVRLAASYLGFVTKEVDIALTDSLYLDLKLRASVAALDAVEVTASTFKAGDNSKSAVLNPLDIVTTAGSMGDVIAAMQTLPGTQANAEDGRLFIRGGDARESAIYVDGLRVFTPYSRTIGGTPSRGRFSPFLFKGVSFSTGGYSAAFGQALSGVLDMQTIDQPDATTTDLSLMTVGFGIGHTQKWDRQSLSLSTSYTNLTPYNWIVPNRLNWKKPYRGFSGEAVYRYQTQKGLLKTYIAGDRGRFSLSQKNLDTQQDENIAINNQNLYVNASFTSFLDDKTSLYAGISAGQNEDQLRLDQSANVETGLNGLHSRLAFKTIFQDHFYLNYGMDWLYQEDKISKSLDQLEGSIQDQFARSIAGSFVEADYFLSKDLAIKAGLRAEYHNQISGTQWAPRITLAQKLSKNSQVSIGYGEFTQEVKSDFLFYDARLGQEKAQHFLINYHLKSEKSLIRAEAYYKHYDRLLTYEGLLPEVQNLGNEGDGYAYGLDVFWRANQLIKYVDFWVSYSWLQHKRDYLNFPSAATPAFSTTHNLSIVTKTWFDKLRSQLGVSYNMASGRPYENPNTEGFLNERSPFYHNISLSWSYLISAQKILFLSVSNAPNFKNNYGYRYGQIANEQGVYPGELIRPNADQFFFAGLFITISADKSKNQLNNL